MIYSWLKRLWMSRMWRCLWRHKWAGPNWAKHCERCDKPLEYVWEL